MDSPVTGRFECGLIPGAEAASSVPGCGWWIQRAAMAAEGSVLGEGDHQRHPSHSFSAQDWSVDSLGCVAPYGR